MALGATAVLLGLLAFLWAVASASPARRHRATSSSPDVGGQPSPGSGSPVSSSDFRLATTFGQPSLTISARLDPGSKPSWTTVSFTTCAASSIVKAPFYRASPD